jgi:hypothetical protein
MLVLFLKMQNTQCGYHRGLSSLMDPPGPKDEEAETGGLPQDREPLRLILPLTRR